MEWKNEFEGLEEISGLKTSCLNAKNAECSQKAQSVYLSTLAEQAKRNIRRIAFGIEKPKRRRVYIHRHQQVLMRMWDAVVGYTQRLNPRPKGDPPWKEERLSVMKFGLHEKRGKEI